VMLDAAASAGLTAWAAAGLAHGLSPEVPLGLFELKDEVIGLGHDVVGRISEWHRGLSRFDRSERLAAAHAILVISSYFEALEAADLLVPVSSLELSAAEQAALAAGSGLPDGYADLVELLLREPLPLPEPHVPYADVRRRLSDCYARLSSRLLRFVSELAVWEELDELGQHRLREAVRQVPAGALERYDERYRRLAIDNREFQVWAGLTELRALGTALSGVSALLAEMAARGPGERPRVHLLRSYQAALDDPVAGSGQAPEGVVLPRLRDAYVNPVCRIAEIGPGDTPSVSQWWDGQAVVPDVEVFLAGYLTSPRAVRAPLVVLGEPGSGKSKLAEVLAARLPEQDFLPVLVELRDVAAESLVLEQVEQAIVRGPGERVSWHDLLDAADGALPVLLLDGFDELVQAAAVSRYDYLEQVREFQHRQEQVGRPVAVIVTSRTVVADQTRFPAESLAVRLEPFTPDQIRRWVATWNRYNADGLARRGLQPLTTVAVNVHGELAEQPLLLLMLAIFDAAGNGLQRLDARIGRAELYERLFLEFAFREVSKSARNRALPTDRQARLAERDLQRLAIVALAMFNRGRQSASDAELDLDLPLLFPGDNEPAGDGEGLTPAQRATGRFFFVHKSQALLRGETTRAYEFLHATFGEFLVARVAVTALRDLTSLHDVMERGMRSPARLDDGYLQAALSFSYMAERTPIVGFLAELLGQIPDDERSRCRQMLATLAARSLHAHPNRSFQEYEPIRHTAARRLAVYSANLVLMLVLLGGQASAQEFCEGTDIAKGWTQFGYLWRSALTTSEWRGLVDTIRVRVSRPDGRFAITLAIEDGSPITPSDCLLITENNAGLTHFDLLLAPAALFPNDAQIPNHSPAGRVFRDAGFLPSWHAGTLLTQTIPSIRVLGGDSRIQPRDKVLLLPGYLLANLDYNLDAPPGERASLYKAYLEAASGSPDLTEQILLRLRQETRTMPPATLINLLQAANAVPPTATYLAMINELSHRPDAQPFRKALTNLAAEIRGTWPDADLTDLEQVPK
jgi:hypothetical protein